MSSNTRPSGFRNPFSRHRGRDQEQNSPSESNPAPRPNSPSATSPGFRKRIGDVFRSRSRNHSPNPASRVDSLMPDMATSVPIDVTLRQPTVHSSDAVPETHDFSSKPTNAIDEAKVSEAHSRASKRAERIWKGFVHLAKFIEPLFEGTPFRTPIHVLTVIAEVVENVKDVNDSADKAFEDLVRLLVIMERAIKETEDSESLNRIDTFVSFLIRKAQYVYNIQHTPWWKKTIDIENYQEMVDGVMKELGQVTKHLFVDLSLAIERDTKLIRKLLESIERKEWLRAPTAMYDSDTANDTPKRGRCTEGTRIEVLKRIHDWATDNSPSSPPIFWLSGRAGMGKSTIAYTVCQTFQSSNIRGLGASFFCSRQVDGLRRLGNIVPTLAYQLAKHSSSFANALRSIDHDIIHNSDKHIDHLLLHPWRSSSKDRPDDLPPTLLVIDALDEIDDDGGPKLLQSLIGMMAEVGPSCMRGLKILITSRPHPSIVDTAQSLSREAIYHLEDIEKETGRGDIVKFLVDSLPELETSYRDELEGLADLSNGLFIYAATVVRLISRRGLSTMQKAKRMTAILLEQDARLLQGESLLVDNLYSDIIRDSISNHADEIRRFRLTALHGILCALQPLSVKELSELISGDSDDVDPEAVLLLVDDLHAVTYISNDRIYTYHKSFSDYLFDEQRCDPEITCKPDASHHVFARGCFRIMRHSLHINICRLPSSYLLDSEVEDLHESITQNITSVMALEYACRYWPSHLIKVPTTGEADHSILHEMLEFTQSEKVLFWIEVMNLLSIKATCYNGVNSVVTWVAKIKEYEFKSELQLTLTAISRLVKSFLQTSASLSTPHLYISSLAAEFASNPEMPHEWRAGFPRLPYVRFAGISNHGGVLTYVDVGSAVQSVAFSADGQRVVSGSDDDSVCIWDASTGKQLQKLEDHTRGVTSVAFSTDGRRVVSGSDDKSVRIWDASTGKQLQKLEGHVGVVNSVAFSTDNQRIVSGSGDKSVRIWDASTGKELQRLNGHADGVNSVAFSTDSQRVVSGSDDDSVRMWDTSTGKELQKLEGHAEGVTSVVFSIDGQRVVSGSHDGSVRIWDVSAGKVLLELEGHAGPVTSVVLSTDSQHVVSGSEDESVRIWDVSTGKELQKLEGHSAYVTSVALSTDGQRVVSGSNDSSVRIWDVSTTKVTVLQKLEGYIGAVTSIESSPDGQCDVSGSEGQSLCVWGHTNCVTSIAFSTDGQRVISGSYDHSVRIWDASTGKQLQKLEGHIGAVKSVAFSTDNQRIVSGSGDKSVRIWGTSTGKELQRLNGHADGVTSVAFSTDGQRVVSGSWDSSVRIWVASTGKELQNFRLEGYFDHVTSVAFSADGERVVSGSWDKSVRIWDASTGQQLQKLKDHTDRVTSVAFSADGERVVSGSWDKSVRIWDASTGQQLQKLEGHTAPVNSVSFSADGQRVVSGSWDKLVRIWDASTGKKLQKLEDHTDRVISVTFSTDGQRVASGSLDESVRIWDMSIGNGDYVKEWTSDPDGWVISKGSNHRLIWLPTHVHPGLCNGYVRLVISRKPYTIIDFSSACLGCDWTKCYVESES